jgi:hypothetical protein
MTFRKIGYAAVIAVAAAAVIGSAGSSEAKTKKMAAPPEPQAVTCWFTLSKNVCGDKSGMKFSYYNACYARKDGAKVTSQGACKAPHMKMAKKMKK